MANPGDSLIELRRQLEALREKIQHLKGGRPLNEETTKNALIAPLLQALGWDTTDPEEVVCEYSRDKRDGRVDYALLLQRTPCLFVEAKSCGADISDRRWTNQVISYSTQAGVGWVVLTNGIDYHIYNANAPVPLEGKLFKRLSLSETPITELIRDFSLLTKEDFFGKRIDRAWEAHHVDTQVLEILSGQFADGGSDALVRLITRSSGGKLGPAAIRASLLRADIRVSFPPAPVEAAPSAPDALEEPSDGEPRGPVVGIPDLIRAGLLRPPVALVSDYMGHHLTATIRPDGQIEMGGEVYASLSTAAGMARVPHFKGDLKERPFPQTNGWTFWRTIDPESGQLVPLDTFRRRLPE
jgi:hypothetical protein